MGTSSDPEQAEGAPATTNIDQYGNAVDEHAFYCPACGRRYDYQRQCTGSPEAPHAPVEVVSTDELEGADHTAAPPSE